MLKLVPWLLAASAVAVVVVDLGGSVAGVRQVAGVGGPEAVFPAARPLVWASEKINAVIGASSRSADDPEYTASVRRGDDPTTREELILK